MKAHEKRALEMDASDPLRAFRHRFALPSDSETIYFCNNSLGLPAADTFPKMEATMTQWKGQGVEGWFDKKNDWYRSFDQAMKRPLAHILGALEDEVVVMNSLTVNLHLLLTSFYQPTASRYKILIEGPTFPSDIYAVKSHLKLHGFDPEEALLSLEPRPGEHLLRAEDIERVITEQGKSIALVFLSSVNFLSGQVLDMGRITSLARKEGCVVGYDLAHAAGNIPLKLHDWGIDFAVGCSYKYLCSGPGGPGIAFVHAKHHHRDLPRLSGWWGNDPATRFQMQLQPEFIPFGGASSWRVSTPSILGMVPLRCSLGLCEEAGMAAIRRKSEQMTKFLMGMLDELDSRAFEVITPRHPMERGSQISLLIHQEPERFLGELEKAKVICDFRPPNIIRVTPSPLYNSYHEIYRFVKCFAGML